MKSFILFSCLALFSISVQGQCASGAFGGCVDVSLSVTGTTLTVNFEPTGSITTPFNQWQSSVLTIRWAEESGGGNPISALTNPTAGTIDFNFQKDEMVASSGFTEAVLDNGYYYQKFSGVPSASTFDLLNSSSVFSVDFTTAAASITFELVDNSVNFVSSNNGSPSIQRLFGETFQTFSTPTITYNAPTFPVEWLYFDAEAVNSREAALTWATATEGNNNFFQIEKSVDGELFEPIARVQGVGNSNTTQEYDYLDKDYVASKVFYRLKQVDFDGAFQHSDIVEVNFEASLSAQLEFELFPNPAHSVVTLKALQRVEGTYRVEIVDVTGRKVWKGLYEEDVNGLTIPVDRLAEGIYTVYLVGTQLGTNHLAGRFVKK